MYTPTNFYLTYIMDYEDALTSQNEYEDGITMDDGTGEEEEVGDVETGDVEEEKEPDLLEPDEE